MVTIFLILSYLKQDWAILVAVFSFPFVKQFSIFGLQATLPGLLLSLLFFVLLTKIVIKKRKIKKTPLDLPFGLLIIAVIISGLNAINKKAYLVDTLHLIQFIAVYYLAVNLVSDTQFVKKIVLVFLLTLLLQSFYGIAQFITQKGPSESWLWESGGVIVRASGTAQLQLPVFLSPAILFCMTFLVYTERKIEKIFFMFPLLFFLVALYFTLVRGAWIACLFGILTILFLIHKDKFLLRKMLTVLASLMIITIVIIPIFPNIGGRIIKTFHNNTAAERTIQFRIDFWKETLKMFVKHPMIGVGFNNYSTHLPATLKYMEGQDPYNLFLRFLGETGIIGFSAWIFVLFRLFRSCWKNFNNPISTALAGVMVAWLLQSLYGTVLVGGFGDLYFFLMGIWINYNYLQK